MIARDEFTNSNNGKVRYLTHFDFFKNTPLVDLKNTIYFSSNEERDLFFSKAYERVEVKNNFNFIKDRGTIRIAGNYKDFTEVNYCRFKSEFEPDRWYYCFIPEFKYLNNNVIELHLLIDGIMTFCQGDILDSLNGITVTRQHLPKKEYHENLDYLRNNSDVIKTHTKKYFYKNKKTFSNFSILMQSSVNLFSDFGTQENPRIESPTGAIIDDVSSPMDLYICRELDFNYIMEELKPFPWITQNFKKIVLVPNDIISINMEGVKTTQVSSPSCDLSKMYKINDSVTKPYDNFLEDLNFSESELLNLFGFKEDEKHLLRNEYTTIELYNWIGGNLIIDPGQLKDGLRFKSISVGGYENEIAIYVLDYKSRIDNIGSYLNDSIKFNSFDDIPILIDSFGLAMAKSAHSSAYTESNLLSGKVNRVIDRDNSISDRLVAGASILSNISPTSIINGLIDEHEYYREQQARELDLALNPDEVTPSNYTNALTRKSGDYGVTLLMSKPNQLEIDKVRKYYKLFGFEVEGLYGKLLDTRSMTVCNYVEFKGTYNIPGAERSIEDFIKTQFENGVRLWHNKNIANPFKQNPLNNKMVK